VWTAAAALPPVFALAGVLFVPYLDPDRPAKEAAAQLAAGKPVTWIAETGGPRWRRWCTGGEQAAMNVSPDGAFHVHTGGLTLLELLPDPGRERYRFRAEIRHENVSSIGEVGIYLGRHVDPTPQGGIHSFFLITFDDIRRPGDGLPPALAARVVIPAANSVTLKVRYWRDLPPPRGWDAESSLQSAELFQPAGWGLDHWRKVAVEVRPEAVTAFWEDGQPVGPPLPVPTIVQGLTDLLKAKRRAAPDDPSTAVVRPDFNPRGGLGLYVRFGSAAFWNVVIEPLN